MIQEFEFLEHSADVRIVAKGSNNENLFTAALAGLCEVILPNWRNDTRDITISQYLKVKSVDITALLIDFLSEVLSLSHQNKCLFCEVKFKHLNESSLEAEIRGFEVDKFEEDVKAVTYHEAEVIFKDYVYQTVIVLDI